MVTKNLSRAIFNISNILHSPWNTLQNHWSWQTILWWIV